MDLMEFPDADLDEAFVRAIEKATGAKFTHTFTEPIYPLQGHNAWRIREMDQKFIEAGFRFDGYSMTDLFLKGILETSGQLIPMFGIVHTPWGSEECPDPETVALVYVYLCTNPRDQEFHDLTKGYERFETEGKIWTMGNELCERYGAWLRRRSADLSQELASATGMPLRVHIEAHDPEAYPKIVWKGDEPREIVSEVKAAAPLILHAEYRLLTVQEYLRCRDGAFTAAVYSGRDPIMEMAGQLSKPLRDGGFSIKGTEWYLTD